MKASAIYLLGLLLVLSSIAVLVLSQMMSPELYGIYYNDPLDNNSNELPYPCIILELRKDGTFKQTAYLASKKVQSLQGIYTLQHKSLTFSDFIFYDYQIVGKKLSRRTFLSGKGTFQVGVQHWFGSISIPSGNDEDNYYVKPRGQRCSALP